MSKQKRRKHTSDQKVAILQRHLVDKVPVSDLCNEYKLQPSVFYGWLKQAMANLGAAMGPMEPNGAARREKELVAENEQLKAKLVKKDSVIAKISEEYVQLKKDLGDL